MPTKDKIMINIRAGTSKDFLGLKTLYCDTANHPNSGLSRKSYEITDEYINQIIQNSNSRGIIRVVELVDAPKKLIGSIHAYSPVQAQFSHVLSDLTIAIHPEFHGYGVGRKLFTTFLDDINNELSHIRRVELLCRISNKHAFKLYESLGFVTEGILRNRIYNQQGFYEDDILMTILL